MWDLIVSVPDHSLFFYLKRTQPYTKSILWFQRQHNLVRSISWQILIRRKMEKKSRFTQRRPIYTAMHGGLLYILLHHREYSDIYFTGISANQIHLSLLLNI